MGAMKTTGENSNKNNPLTRQDWIDTARTMLIEEGVSSLSLRRIASRLGATTGAFYWLFSNLEDMLAGLRKDWETRNSAAFDAIFDHSKLDCYEKYIGYVRVVLKESGYDPKYDSAMRDWANSNELTREVLTRVDNKRISQLQTMFGEMGFNQRAARVRALMTYFHQSGYYWMGVEETLEERLANIPYYAEILIGSDFFSEDMTHNDLRNLILGEQAEHNA